MLKALSLKPNFIRKIHFDTRQFAEKLERTGLSAVQANALLNNIQSSVQSTLTNLNTQVVSKNEFSRRVYQQKVDFTKLRADLQSLDKTQFSRLTDSQEQLKTDIEKTRQLFKESVNKARANIKLDLNLEKGRVREESASHELRLQELNARIDQELQNFKTQIESTKVQVLQWLIGVCTGTFALVLAYIRLLT